MYSVEQIFNVFDSFDYTGCLDLDISSILKEFEKLSTYDHLKAVADRAMRIAGHYNVDRDSIYKAAILHDISAIVPNDLRVDLAQKLEVNTILKDDWENPIMLHGKISAEIARRYFDIENEEVLNAMRYHTTLRPNAEVIEQIVFIADKIALDPTETHNAEYMEKVASVVNDDVTKACWYYLDWMFDNLEELGWQRHYDAVAAYDWLNSIYKK